MAIYKGIEIDAALAGLIRHMQGVEDYRETLGKLQGTWDILSLLGQLTGAATEMGGTREAFERLTGDLLNHLGRETRRKAIADLHAKTQTAIDILVRNLFERTADIGFLAADDDLREFLAGTGRDRAALENRFREYVAKYSVYSDIVLFDAADRVAARLSPHPAAQSGHPLLAEARGTAASFVEYFGAADFLPPGQHLVYAFRVEAAPDSQPGVLALVFRLEDEMQGIYAKQLGDRDFTLLAAFDPQGRVVASSSPIQLPLGTPLERAIQDADGEVVRLAGREYLGVACPAHSYQGYPGPGWRGLGLIPLEFAFACDDTPLLGHIDGKVLAAVARHPTLFSADLRRIPQLAEHIQEDLNRSVWNGSVRQVASGDANASFAKTLLWEISNTGRKTQETFARSIGNLHETVVAALLQNSVARAAFAIDVMDRNLYERANDCRWWALNATFRRVLAEPAIIPAEAERCSEILGTINGLYTVYHNLILFNALGQAVAVSNPDCRPLLGNRLGEEWVGRCLALTSAQGYVFSPFQATPLYAGQPTYVFAAAVRDPGGQRVVGGIAIVFDGGPQFAAMLDDALPRRDGQPVPGALALLASRDGRVLASSHPDFPAGSRFPLGEAQTRLGRGERGADIVDLGGNYYALGAALSAGYREYKTSDGQIDDILALLAFPLGPSAEAGPSAGDPAPRAANQGRARRIGNSGEYIEIATFHVGGQWLGLPAANVVEAVGTDDMTPVLGGNNDLVAGVKMYRGGLISVLHLGRLLTPGAPIPDGARQIVVVRTNGKVCLGLLVDQLGEIPEVASNEIQAVGQVAVSANALTVGIVNGMRRSGDRDGILSVLASERLCQRLGCYCGNDGEAARPQRIARA